MSHVPEEKVFSLVPDTTFVQGPTSLSPNFPFAPPPQHTNSSLYYSPLITRLSPPPMRCSFVSRPRLVERLNQITTHKLALVLAPAGFGKTILLSEWQRQSMLPVAWISLNEGENTFCHFLAYCIATLQTIHPSIGTTLWEQLDTFPHSSMTTLLTSLINDITTLNQEFVLVLDDYHVIQQPVIHQAITFLLSHLPASMHLIISSRSIPVAPLSRLYIENAVIDLGPMDLRFTREEISQFLTRVMKLDLMYEEIVAFPEFAAQWIEQAAETMIITRGEWAILIGWLELLPHNALLQQARLRLIYVWALFFVERLKEAEILLEEIVYIQENGTFQGTQGQCPEYLTINKGLYLSLRALVAARHGDYATTNTFVQTALKGLPLRTWRSAITLNLGIAAAIAGFFPIAHEAYTIAVSATQNASEIYISLLALCGFATLQATEGKLQQSLTLYKHGLQRARGYEVQRWPVVGTLLIGMGTILRELNQLGTARHSVLEGLAIARRHGDLHIVIRGLLVLANIQWAQGEFHQAQDTLQEAKKLVFTDGLIIDSLSSETQKNQAWASGQHLSLLTRSQLAEGIFELRRGNHQRALHILVECAPSLDCYILIAQVYIAQKKMEEARILLENLFHQLQETDLLVHKIAILALHALILPAQSQQSIAISQLEDALTLAEPEGYIRIFVDIGLPLKPLLTTLLERQQHMLHHSVTQRYISHLLLLIQQQTIPQKNSTASLLETDGKGICSEREIEVLSLLAAGKTNQEIADKLILTVGTVKRHLHNISGKLQARNRTEAIARARELRLIA